MHRQEQLSPTQQMYLKVLYRLGEHRDVARVRDMAKGLGVSPGTVSAVVKRLERTGLVKHDRYEAVALTPAGTEVARCMVRRFETVKAILIEVLGLDNETADEDACMMEHAVSPAAVNRMELMIRLVRRGKIDLSAMRRARKVRKQTRCTGCEVTGVCQAESRAAAS